MSKKIVLKSVLAVVMVGFVLCVSSCKKDDLPKKEEPKEEVNEIIGIWKYEEAEIKELTSSIPNLDAIIKSYFQEAGISETLGSVFDGTYEFTKDGKVIRGSEIASYEVNNKKLTITNLGILSETYDYSISGKKMYWDWNVDLNKIVDEYEELADYKEYIAMMGITKFVIQITFTKQ